MKGMIVMNTVDKSTNNPLRLYWLIELNIFVFLIVSSMRKVKRIARTRADGKAIKIG